MVTVCIVYMCVGVCAPVKEFWLILHVCKTEMLHPHLVCCSRCLRRTIMVAFGLLWSIYLDICMARSPQNCRVEWGSSECIYCIKGKG